jgi:L-ascorbate metabolism protein UlaG (beta-lactamase superfamily)
MMSVRLTWLAHATWLIELGATRIVLDPFLTGNPAAKIGPNDLGEISHILVSHAHHDHVADVAEIAKTCDATLIANFEITQWFQKHHGLKKAIGMNTGGIVRLPCGEIMMTPAFHSSSFADGSYGGCPSGFLLTASSTRVYFACDTAFFSDMAHYALHADCAVLPIGDLFTMGIDESIRAIRLIEPRRVLPTHYGTWPPIDQDAEAWAQRVRDETSAEPTVLAVGQTIEI